MDAKLVRCDNCNNDSDEQELIVLRTVIGQIVIGARDDGSLIPDGEPIHIEVEHTAGQVVWCTACESTTEAVPIEDSFD